MWQLVLNLRGKFTTDVKDLKGEAFDADQMGPYLAAGVRQWSHFHRMMLAYLFGDYDRAEIESEHCVFLVESPFGATDVVMVLLYDTLTKIVQGRRKPKLRYVRIPALEKSCQSAHLRTIFSANYTKEKVFRSRRGCGKKNAYLGEALPAQLSGQAVFSGG